MLVYLKNNEAQATVEAAIMIPVIFLLLLLLIQPGIYLYDLCIMNEAATETCRVLATSSDIDKAKVCDAYTRIRLGAIPQQDNFHLHSSGCSYEITYDGNQNNNEVSVTIKNQLKPLPLIGFLSEMFGLLNENNCLEVEATASQISKPSWVSNSPQGSSPENWVGNWLQ